MISTTALSVFVHSKRSDQMNRFGSLSLRADEINEVWLLTQRQAASTWYLDLERAARSCNLERKEDT